MRAKIQKWGNGLGVCLPKALADDVRLSEGSMVELLIDRGASRRAQLFDILIEQAAVSAACARRNRLHAGGPQPAGRKSMEQCARHQRFAHAGIGAGNEQAGGGDESHMFASARALLL